MKGDVMVSDVVVCEVVKCLAAVFDVENMSSVLEKIMNYELFITLF